MASSADRSTYLIVLHKGLLERPELDAYAQESVRRRMPLLRLLEARLDAQQLERVVRTRARHARHCERCNLTTHLLPRQDEANTPCEHCGGRLRIPARHQTGQTARPRPVQRPPSGHAAPHAPPLHAPPPPYAPPPVVRMPPRPAPAPPPVVRMPPQPAAPAPHVDATMWSEPAPAQPMDDRTMWEGDDGAPIADPQGTIYQNASGLGGGGSEWLASSDKIPRPVFPKASERVSLPEERHTPGRLGDYWISDIIGQGAMGTVYRAFREGGSRDVALKVIQGAAVTHSLLERFDREAQILTSLEHPGILRVYDAGEVEGVPYMACELIEDARDLREALQGQKARFKIERIRDVSRALGYAHSQGVAHRDVKPDNVLVDAQGKAYVADFGLASADELEAITVAGTQLGTPAFMAPEQVTAERDLQGPASDVWALGVLLYEAMLGVRPFRGKSFPLLFRAILAADPKRPRELDQRIPVQLEEVMMRCLQRDPQARYPDGAALAAALDGVLAL